MIVASMPIRGSQLAKILALLRLSVNFFSVTFNKKSLKINFVCFKELNINEPVFFVFPS